MKEKLFVGAISGTSVDGLDLALLEVSDHLRVVAAKTFPLDAALRAELLQLGQPGAGDLDRLGSADAALGCFIGDTILAFLRQCGTPPDDIAAIGSHGQTVRHRPSIPHRFTLQIGDPNIIAEVTGITTIADFRRRDMAAGGQGAPLVPPFHAALFQSAWEHRAILNIGGISNLTLLPAGCSSPIIGFDVGPGNGLMDAWIFARRGLPFDEDGAWSRMGKANIPLLKRLIADPYFALPPPKSTGREYFNLPWLQANFEPPATTNLAGNGIDDQDVQATLRALTAAAIAAALNEWGPATARVIVCGGGRLNRALLDELRARLPMPVDTTEDHGVDGDSVESAAFAWLAHRTISGLEGNAPTVTGASGPRILGAIYHS